MLKCYEADSAFVSSSPPLNLLFFFFTQKKNQFPFNSDFSMFLAINVRAGMMIGLISFHSSKSLDLEKCSIFNYFHILTLTRFWRYSSFCMHKLSNLIRLNLRLSVCYYKLKSAPKQTKINYSRFCDFLY